jgi:DNA-binding transcriptional LysR family regulator
VQASQTIASYWLPRHHVAFHRVHPRIDIRLKIGNTAEVAAPVRDGVAELGFVEGAVEDAVLTLEQVARDQLVVVVGTDHHHWSDVQRIRAEVLTETEWVLREPGFGTRSEFEAAVRSFGVSPTTLRIALESPSNESVRAVVEAGMGATAISASVVAPSLEAPLLHHVALDLPDRAFNMVRHVERPSSKAAEA